ncbi:MAG: GntR family transcriptional regulator [Acidobacteria bacterium]|nr:GntR family transcriptional regulator [Acidobacteriota bacterium]
MGQSNTPTELELVRQFQVGRRAIRETATSLSVAGLVQVERGKGSFVGELSDFLVRAISLGFKTRTLL